MIFELFESQQPYQTKTSGEFKTKFLALSRLKLDYIIIVNTWIKSITRENERQLVRL